MLPKWVTWAVVIAIILTLLWQSPKVVDKVIEIVVKKGLLPHVKIQWEKVQSELPFKVKVGRTFVTDEEQANVDPSKTGTNNSWHEIGRALDIYVYDEKGKLDMDGKREDLYLILHKTAVKHGFSNIAFNKDWSKRFITTKSGAKKRDLAHIEYRDGMTWAQAKASYDKGATA